MITFSLKLKSKPKLTKVSKTINPHTHWALLLRIFLILICGLIAFSLYLLREIRNEQIFQIKPTIDQKKVILREKLLKTVDEYFDQKAQKESELITTPQTYKDPSI